VSQYQTNIQVAIKHEQPKTTLDSLNQIKNEFSQKLEEANAKNDNAKKRRYQRQLKQFEDAIKATKEGKNFNYAELTVPPGFCQIPLRDGRPIGGGGGGGSTSTSSSGNADVHRHSSTLNPGAPSVKPAPARVQPPAAASKYEDEEASDDLLRYLENEIDDDDLNDIEPDPEEEKYNKLINNASKHINVPMGNNKKNSLPKKIDNFDDDDEDLLNSELGNQIASLKIPQPSQAKQISPKQIPVLPSIPRQPPPQPQPARNVAGATNSVRRVQNKELTIILERQRLFKEAALKAKQEGNQKVALVYLRHSKVWVLKSYLLSLSHKDYTYNLKYREQG